MVSAFYFIYLFEIIHWRFVIWFHLSWKFLIKPSHWNFILLFFFLAMEFHQNSYHPLEFSPFFPSNPWNFQNSNPLEFRCPQQGGYRLFLEKPIMLSAKNLFNRVLLWEGATKAMVKLTCLRSISRNLWHGIRIPHRVPFDHGPITHKIITNRNK